MLLKARPTGGLIGWKLTEIEACKDNGTDSKLTKINEIALDAATIYYSTLHMATNPARVVDRALLQLE